MAQTNSPAQPQAPSQARSQAPEPGTDPGSSTTHERWRRLRAPLAFAGAIAGCTLAISMADPSTSGVYPPCPTKLLTGLDCPACGGLRATYALAHRRLGEAADRNLLFFLAVPLIAVAFVVALVGAWRGTPTSIAQWVNRHSRPLTWIGLAAMVVFTVARNIPGVPYLSSDLG